MDKRELAVSKTLIIDRSLILAGLSLKDDRHQSLYKYHRYTIPKGMQNLLQKHKILIPSEKDPSINLSVRGV